MAVVGRVRFELTTYGSRVRVTPALMVSKVKNLHRFFAARPALRPKPNLSRTRFRWLRNLWAGTRIGSSSCAKFGPTGARTMQPSRAAGDRDRRRHRQGRRAGRESGTRGRPTFHSGNRAGQREGSVTARRNCPAGDHYARPGGPRRRSAPSPGRIAFPVAHLRSGLIAPFQDIWEPILVVWAATIIVTGPATIMMTGGEESTAA